MSKPLSKTTRSQVVRLGKRGIYDRPGVYAIVDAIISCHVAYLIDGEPYCTPTMHWRDGDRIYWHGSAISRFLKQAIGQQVCLSISRLDGMVLARAAFHHSANYHSATLFGRAELIEGEHKERALRSFVERLYPGRWDTLRPITPKELRATTVLSFPIDEGAAKVRTGDPVDDKEDYALPIWAGEIPLRTITDKPQPDTNPRSLKNLPIPEHVQKFNPKKI